MSTCPIRPLWLFLEGNVRGGRGDWQLIKPWKTTSLMMRVVGERDTQLAPYPCY